MNPLTDLVIHVPIKEPEFTRALEAREQREQQWAGGGGKGGDVQPESRLGEVLEALDLSHVHESDLRHAARTLRAKFPDDAGMMALASHVEAWEMYAAEEAEREMVDMGTTESTMESFLRERGVPMVEQRTPIGNRGSRQQHPAQRAPLAYPAGVTPTAEDIDPDRAARGALEPAMSDRLRGLAREVRNMASLSGNARQRNRLMARASELQRMSLTQYQRELENDVAPSDDPTEPNNVMGRLASDMDDEARAAGAQDGDSFRSFDDWDDGSRPGSPGAVADDVDDQKRAAADDMALDEDLPRVPAPGRRYAEDQLGDPAAGTDEPRGQRKNIHDDNIHQRLKRGPAKFGAGRPRGGDRYGGQRRRYSAFSSKESLRESGDLDLTAEIIEDQKLNWYGSHGCW